MVCYYKLSSMLGFKLHRIILFCCFSGKLAAIEGLKTP